MDADGIILSVVIPCFNDGRFLPEAVASAVAIPPGRHEIIVVNDGSTDPQTLVVLSQLAESGVHVIHQSNNGLGAARNHGITVARGRYVLPLDADNHIRAAYIDCGINVLDNDQSIDVVYGDSEYFGDRKGRWKAPEFNLRRLLTSNYIDACAVYRKSAWVRCGGYDEHMPFQGYEDWDLWLRIALSGGRFHHIARTLFEYRVREDSLSKAMSRPEQYQAVLRYVQAKRVEMTIGDYTEPHWSLDLVLERMHNRPLRTTLGLLVRAYLPSLLPPLPTLRQPNERRI